ncbi:hypothetical protein [Burkholderia alba]|uniref:hypothetical protein n=1 Tax=Burkholderia alba TaxID=2683677 RepID=UPI002B0623D7|nr:hypothetical protein [Burkholderia alba]
MNGDTDQLNFVESTHFFVKRGDRILTKSQQIAYIQRHGAEKTWRNFGLDIHNEIKNVAESQRWATISGTGAMQRDNKTLSRFDFLELWLINSGRWQIAALCYEDHLREPETSNDLLSHP